ncbi:spermidine/putrescine ABC transporter periplasmic spermidine/putrescine-binding protein [Novosphingobium nitrogenifigens DSM 19370]|uniref:Spermidine/putrescine ABC transporter periplasmic spermidine/putrescine-binding protein n=1 Tax=Novosphingobium nitrogenifigens DSM 19370 TaxID=983920 RepID=F1Z7W2_9SPHN|nr:spermidine/putrescine ABC transporter periplasmic spermidine/putrescine-binding protein [Novosphingobium nitrogenifigens DSM 19370]
MGGCHNPAANQVNFYTWDTYVGRNTLSGFEKQSGVHVSMSLYSSNDELFAKLRGGNPGYDVVVPSHDFVQRMAKADLLTPLDHAKIPNMANIAPQFQHPAFDPERKYSMPYTWLVLGIGYRKSKVDGVPDSWKWVLDSDRYKGRIALLSDAPDLCRLAEIYLGKNPNVFDRATLKEVEALLIRQKPNVATFHDDNGQDLLLGGDVDIVIEYNGDIAQVIREDKDLAFVVPREGSLIQSDQLCIPVGAPNPDGAHAFINYLLSAEAGADIARTIAYPTPNAAALRAMDAAYRDNPVIFPPQAALAKCQYAQYLGEDAYRAFQDVITRVRAA